MFATERTKESQHPSAVSSFYPFVYCHFLGNQNTNFHFSQFSRSLIHTQHPR